MKRRRLSHILLSFFVCVVAGCASSVSITDKDRQAITKVRVQSQVQMPPHDVYIHGAPVAQTIAAGGGIVGAIAADTAAKAPKTNVIEFATANGFPVSEIVKSEFVRAASAKGAMQFSETESSPSAYLSLTINGLGFGQSQGLGSTMYPLLNVTATLKRPDGAVVWQRTEFVSPLNGENKPGYEYPEYINNPQNMRTALTRVASIVSRALAADLHRGN